MATITNIKKGKKTSSANIDNIQFNSITNLGYGKNIKWVQGDNPWKQTAQSAPEIKYAINAVDIDWNAADLSNIGTQSVSMPTTLYTSGDLLMTIKYLVAENNKLQATVAALVEEALVVNDDEGVVATTTTQPVSL